MQAVQIVAGIFRQECTHAARKSRHGVIDAPPGLRDAGRRKLIPVAIQRIPLAAPFEGVVDFRGNADNYYCERNSLLPRVIETRSGIPLTLTLIYMMVGSRAAMKIEGINLPGHFIARHGEVYFDPFHRGRILSRVDVECILFRQGLELKDCHLQTSTPRQILVRMLANLLYVYDLQGECQKHERVRGWMQALKCRLE